jgi:hypothetical protein
VRKIFVEDGVLVCDEYVRAGDVTTRRRAYMLTDPRPIAMFSKIYAQAAHGERYSDEQYLHSMLDYGVEYVVTTGSRWSLTVNEGGYFNFLGAICRWDDAINMGAKPPDGSEALTYFGAHEFPAFATYVIMIVDYFDALCELAVTVDDELTRECP